MKQTSVIKQGNDLVMMSHTLNLLTTMIEDLVVKQEYKPANIEALSEVVSGVTQIAKGLTTLLADHAKVVEIEGIVNNLSPDQD